MTNFANPDQLDSSEANWSGSTLFAKTGHVVFSRRRAKLSEELSKESKRIRISHGNLVTGVRAIEVPLLLACTEVESMCSLTTMVM